VSPMSLVFGIRRVRTLWYCIFGFFESVFFCCLFFGFLLV
jgi:hypothetical protein